jgi:hypothetical protein
MACPLLNTVGSRERAKEMESTRMKPHCIGLFLVTLGGVVSTAACGVSSASGPAGDDTPGMVPTTDAGGDAAIGHDSSTGPVADGGVPRDGAPSSDAADGSSSGSWADSGLGGTTNALGTITGSPAIARLLALTQSCTAANAISSDPGDFVLDNGSVAHVCSLPGGPGNTGGAVFFTADMDIDCDGIRTANCPGTGANMDPSWDNATSFAGPNSADNAMGQPALASENTPYVVIPEEVVYPGLDQNNGGNIVAVIYNNQIEFAVFGDQIAAEPNENGEDIGEASVRTAKGLGIPASPATGGVGGGVTYIAFVGTGSQPADMENISEIQTLGAQLTESLLDNNP